MRNYIGLQLDLFTMVPPSVTLGVDECRMEDIPPEATIVAENPHANSVLRGLMHCEGCLSVRNVLLVPGDRFFLIRMDQRHMPHVVSVLLI